MAFHILDPLDLLENKLFFEDKFVSAVEEYNWESFRNQKVLVRGCNSALIPPWAYMMITAQLSGLAQSVRYGNEHDHIVIYRAPRK